MRSQPSTFVTGGANATLFQFRWSTVSGNAVTMPRCSAEPAAWLGSDGWSWPSSARRHQANGKLGFLTSQSQPFPGWLFLFMVGPRCRQGNWERIGHVRDELPEDHGVSAVEVLGVSWFTKKVCFRHRTNVKDRKSTRLNSSHLGISYA